MEINNNVLGENIKKKMDEKNLTTFELADRLKITTVELCRYIAGRRMPKAPLIFQMARELDCSADELIGIEGQEQPDPDPGEPTIQKVIEWFRFKVKSTPMPGARKMYQMAIESLEKLEKLEEHGRIPVSGLTDIYVRDKWSGGIHRVGDDQHDQLTIWNDGQLHYYNLQNGDGCSTGDTPRDQSGYEFVPNVDEYGYNCDPREKENEQRNSE